MPFDISRDHPTDARSEIRVDRIGRLLSKTSLATYLERSSGQLLLREIVPAAHHQWRRLAVQRKRLSLVTSRLLQISTTTQWRTDPQAAHGPWLRRSLALRPPFRVSAWHASPTCCCSLRW